MSDKEKNISSRVFMGIFGTALILVGIFLLFGNIMNIFSVKKLWPFFMMIPVVIFISILFQNFKANYGLLMPICILTFLTVYFLWLNYTTWENVAYTWPNFILAPASGLFALYLASRDKNLLIPVCILGALATIFYGIIIRSSITVGIVFITIGVLLFISIFFQKK